MKEVLITLASLMSEEDVLTRLKEAISEFEEAKLLGDEEKIHRYKHHLMLSCHLVTMNHVTREDGTLETIERVKKLEANVNLFKDKQN
jgi:hypothetical protein